MHLMKVVLKIDSYINTTQMIYAFLYLSSAELKENNYTYIKQIISLACFLLHL